MNNIAKIYKILEDAESIKGFYIENCADGYSEPGYSDPEALIVTANWNNDKPCIKESFVDEDSDNPEALITIGNALEKLGCDVEWSDEWTVCSICHKLVRTQPNSYSWTQSYYTKDCYIICHECIKNDKSLAQEYIEHHIGKPNSCLTMDVDLEECGFEQIDQPFANGYYGGQDADPKVISEWLEGKGINRYVFVLDSVGQFDMRFSVWVDKDQAEALNVKQVEKW